MQGLEIVAIGCCNFLVQAEEELNMAVFWVVAPCNSENSHLRTHRRENLKSYLEDELFYFIRR
jgi:hypothetical protein